MSGITMQIEGIEEFKKALASATEDIREAVRAEVAQATLRVHERSIDRIQRGNKTGFTYEKYVPRRTHQASAPFQAPASDTGRLASSIEWRMDNLEGTVFTRVDYGRYLEFGTKSIEPRPWLLPSVEEAAPRFREGLMGILQ